jgi:hypothetical protein
MGSATSLKQWFQGSQLSAQHMKVRRDQLNDELITSLAGFTNAF